MQLFAPLSGPLCTRVSMLTSSARATSRLVQGGDAIRRVVSADVGGILQKGGTVFGTARSAEFRAREGRLRPAGHLLERNIDALVVIGGDGSLTGANLFPQEWSGLLAELVAAGSVEQEVADRPPSAAGRSGRSTTTGPAPTGPSAPTPLCTGSPRRWTRL